MSRVLFLLLAALAANAVAAVRAELRAHVDTAAPRLTLGDVAQLHGAAAEVAALAAFPVAPAPRPGYPQRITRSAVDAALRRAGTAVQWGGRDAVEVAAVARTVASDELSAAAVAPFAGGPVQAAVLRVPAPVSVPDRAYRLVPRTPRPAALGPRTLVTVDIVVDGLPFRSVEVPLALTCERTVRVARANLGVGDALTPDQFDLLRRNVVALPDASAAADPLPPRARLAHALRAGAVLTNADLAPDGVVLAGDRVTVAARAGTLAVELSGTALRAALPGQQVEVRVAPGAQPLTGTLAGNRTVVVN